MSSKTGMKMKVAVCFSLLVLFLASTEGKTIFQPCINNPNGICVNLDTHYCQIGDYYVNSGCKVGYTCCSKYVEKQPPKISYGSDQCGVPSINKNNKVVGGKTASIGEYPWMVSVQKYREHNCGGSIIGDRWILTAAHCIGSAPESYTVKTNTQLSDIPMFSRIYEVESIHYPSAYNFKIGFQANDIALIRLTKPIKLGSYGERKICLPESTENFHQRICVATGWGSAIPTDGQKYGGDVTRDLKQVALPVINNEQCKPYWKNLYKGVICAGYKAGGDDTCVGDSGGPLVCQDKNGYWKQAGIVSLGRGCAQAHEMGVYTDVAYYRKWIDSVLNGY